MQSMKRDPAPSKISYRLSRLWLTPWVKRAARVGPPLLLLFGFGVYAATDTGMRNWIGGEVNALREMVETRDGLMVDRLVVAGAGPELSRAVTETAAITLPLSSLKLDVKKIRKRIETLPAVASASVRIGSGGALEISVRERLPAAVWRVGEELAILDAEGVVLGTTPRRADHPELPLLLGAGVRDHVSEVLALDAIAHTLRDRVRGWQRIGSRRWTIVLDNGQKVLLPEDNADQALSRVIGIDAADSLFERDVAQVDMRDPSRPVLRIGSFGLRELRRIQRIQRGEEP